MLVRGGRAVAFDGGCTLMPLWDETRALIGEGEADVALNLIETFLKGRLDGPLGGRARPLLDTVVMLRARGRRMAISSVQGVLTAAESDVERARRDQAVLGLISEVERMDNLRPPTVAIELPDRFLAEKLMGSESQLQIGRA